MAIYLYWHAWWLVPTLVVWDMAVKAGSVA